MRSALGLVRLETADPIALGTTVVLHVLDSSPPETAPAAAAEGGTAESTALRLAQEWPGAREAEVQQGSRPKLRATFVDFELNRRRLSGHRPSLAADPALPLQGDEVVRDPEHGFRGAANYLRVTFGVNT